MSEPAPTLAPDTLVLDGRFRVLERLGAGGMGEVYLGEQVSLGRRVAIKVLHRDLHAQPGMAERFKREARLLSAVDHPAVVRVIEFGETRDAACLVMELVEGESLHDALARGPFPPARALPVLLQLAEGLAAIHARGIIHRDLKPENVLLTQGPAGEQARLLDFGIARLAEPDPGAPGSNLSQVGVVLGTPEYLSPEQAMGGKVDARADLYSLGVLAYRTLSGQLPFAGPTARHFLAQHAHHAPRPLFDVAPFVAACPGVVPIVMRLLEKDPGHRFQSAHAVAEALQAALAVLPRQSLLGLQPAATAAAPAAPAPAGSGTAVFGLPPGGTVAYGVPAVAPQAPAHTGRRQNLTVMLTDIQGYTERTSRQTREENARMLATHDRLLLPLVRGHGGRLVNKRGDALFVVFPSPTDAVLCGMALQDRLWRHNARAPEAERLHVRVCLHAGEVLLARDAVLGEPVEVVERVEKAARAGDVTFTEAVNLARNRAEAAAERVGELPPVEGAPGAEPLALYRCVPRTTEGAPFGGLDLRAAGPVDRLREALQAVRDRLRRQKAAPAVAGPGASEPAALGTLAAAGAGPGALPGAPAAAGAAPPMDAREAPAPARAAALPHAATDATPRPAHGASSTTGPWAERRAPVELAGPAGASAPLAAPTPAPDGRRRTQARGAAAALVLVLAAVLGALAWRSRPEARAGRLLDDGKAAEALALLDAERPEGDGARQVRGAALHVLGRHEEEHQVLAALGEDGRGSPQDRVLAALAEDFGRDEGDKRVRRVLSALDESLVRDAYEDLAEGEPGPVQWGALRYLEAMQATDDLDLVELYAQALGHRSCSVRARAARRLQALGNAGAVPALERLLASPREKGLFGGKSCGHDEAEDALKALKRR